MITLRPYQLAAVNTLWNALKSKNSALCVASCGSGKTEIMIELCTRAVKVKPDVRILIVINKVGLVKQTADRMFPLASVYCSSLNSREISPITVASVQSIHKADLDKVNWVIVDECHRLTTDEGSLYHKLFKQLREKNDRLKVIGFTATPYSSTGHIYGPNQLFDKIDYQITLEELWAQGYLVKPRCKAGHDQFETSHLSIVAGDFSQGEVGELVRDSTKVQEQIKDAMPRLVGRRKIAWACANIEHAELVRVSIGEQASIIHSKMKLVDREIQQHRFEKMNTRHIVFVNVLSEGYDYPPVDAIVLMCPTRSPVKYVQCIGRGLRLSPDKDSCLVLDYGQVIENCGPITDPFIRKKGSKKSVKNMMKFCPSCMEYVQITATTCPCCEYVFPVKKRETALTRTAFDGSITSKKIELYKVKNVSISEYVSKNGNPCLRVTYVTTDLMHSAISEYFVWWNEYAEKRAAKRLEELGCLLYSDLAKTALQQVTRVPTHIEVIHERYAEVKRIIYSA